MQNNVNTDSEVVLKTMYKYIHTVYVIQLACMCTPEFHISGYSTCIYYQRHSKQGNQLMLSVVAFLYIRIHTYIQHLVQITIMQQASDKRLML